MLFFAGKSGQSGSMSLISYVPGQKNWCCTSKASARQDPAASCHGKVFTDVVSPPRLISSVGTHSPRRPSTPTTRGDTLHSVEHEPPQPADTDWEDRTRIEIERRTNAERCKADLHLGSRRG